MADLIDRQAAIDAILSVTGNSSVRELYEHVQEHGLSEMWSGGVNAAIDIIIALPSAQLQHKTGKWRKMHYNPWYECSLCGWESDATYNFCPNCGADMI